MRIGYYQGPQTEGDQWHDEPMFHGYLLQVAEEQSFLACQYPALRK